MPPSNRTVLNRAEGIAAVVRYDFYTSGASESGQRFGIPVLTTALRNVERIANVILNWLRKDRPWILNLRPEISSIVISLYK